MRAGMTYFGMYRWVQGNPRTHYIHTPLPKKKKPTVAEVKYVKAIAKLKKIQAEENSATANLNGVRSIINDFRETRKRQNEYLRQATAKGVAPDKRWVKMHAIKGKVSYEEFVDASKKLDELKTNMTAIGQERALTEAEVDRYEPFVDVKSNDYTVGEVLQGMVMIGALVFAVLAIIANALGI